MELVYGRPRGLKDAPNGYCAGCMHSTASKLIAQVLDENDWLGDTIAILPIGCALNTVRWFDMDAIQSAHGRAAATAVGAKKMAPDKLIFTYQGDGDAAAIGLAETMHAANRGDPITVIMINNQIYGMTGGQISPTTRVGQKTVTTGPQGRDPAKDGYPMHMAEIIASLRAPGYVARFALHKPGEILKAKKGIETAFRRQLEQGQYAFVELLSACPTNWGVPPRKTPALMDELVIPEFPLGEFKK